LELKSFRFFLGLYETAFNRRRNTNKIKCISETLFGNSPVRAAFEVQKLNSHRIHSPAI